MEWRWVAVFVCVCISSSGASLLKIRPAGNQFTKSLGSSIVFTCEVIELDSEAETAVRLRWIGGDGKEILESGGRVYLDSDGSSVKKLYITEIQDGDNGTYTCTSNINGVTETKAVILQIFKEITFDYAPSPQHPVIHKDGLVVCRVSGTPKPGVSWRVKGRRILGDNRFILEEGALRIRNVTENDSGVYSCRAEVDEDGRYSEQKIAVIVYVPPAITSFQNEVEAIEGHNTTISCEATGTPTPVYEFYKGDGQKVENTSRSQVGTNAGLLHLISISTADEGTYQCQAINEVGRESFDIKLKVLIIPSIYALRNVTVSEGDTTTIDCLSSGVPVPDMLFFKGRDSKEIGAEHNESGRLFIKQSPGQLSLTIVDLIPSDAGVYTCTSTNVAGHSARFALLTVNYEPRLESDLPSTVHGWAGKIQNISCRATGEPAPLFEWSRNGEILTSNITYHIYDVAVGVSILEVRITTNDADWIYSNYTCRATNFLGKVEHQFQLIEATVPEPPKARVDELSPDGLVIVVIPGSDGGLRVTGYSVEYGNNIEEFERLTTEGDSVPMPLIFKNLKSNKTYVFRIYAKNDVGVSQPTELQATTDEFQLDELQPPAVAASVGNGMVIGIIVAVFFVFLVVIDVSCYFVNNCGLTMCICVQLCGRKRLQRAPNEMEEGESKEILKETPPDLEPDEAKSSQEDLEEEKKHLADTRDIDSPHVETVEELIEQPPPDVEKSPQPEERRGPPSRKSILSYGDGRWRDVVHELETQLGVVKKPMSDDDSSDEQPNRRDYNDDN